MRLTVMGDTPMASATSVTFNSSGSILLVPRSLIVQLDFNVIDIVDESVTSTIWSDTMFVGQFGRVS